MKLDEILHVLAVIAALVLIVGTGSYLWWSNYNECRAHGFSVYYCWSRK